MPKFILPAYSGEGSTDERFLGPVIRRTLDQLLQEANQQVFSQSIIWIGKASGQDGIMNAARKAHEYTVHIYCSHADADGPSYETAFQQRIEPAFRRYDAERKEGDKMVLIPVIPVHMTEAWMLADTTVLKDLIRTNLSDADLGWAGNPEKKANPKQAIKDGLRIANRGRGAHLRVKIDKLYGEMSEEISLQKLDLLPSFQKFKAAARAALVQLGYLQ